MTARKHTGNRRSLTVEERRLWAEVTQTVKSRMGVNVTSIGEGIETDKISAQEKTRVEVESTPPAGSGRSKELPLAPIEKRFRQRLIRGRREISTKLDLHGMRQTQAHASLIEILRRAQNNDEKLVLVVTGKGRAKSSSDEEVGILKRMVPHWLAATELRSIVLGFEPASAIHGGDGALYVRIRRKRDRE